MSRLIKTSTVDTVKQTTIEVSLNNSIHNKANSRLVTKFTGFIQDAKKTSSYLKMVLKL